MLHVRYLGHLTYSTGNRYDTSYQVAYSQYEVLLILLYLVVLLIDYSSSAVVHYHTNAWPR